MSPVQIQIALHYATQNTEYNNGDFSDPLVTNTIQQFQDSGLLDKKPADMMQPIILNADGTAPPLQSTFNASEGLQLYIDELSKVPLPRLIWTA